MLFFGFLVNFVASNPVTNYLLIDKFGEDPSELLKMMILSPGLMGRNQLQSDQMSQILPFMMFEENISTSKTLMLLMMSEPASNVAQFLPFLLLNDGTDLVNLFLTSTMMQANCQPTNQQFNHLLSLLLKEDDASIDSNMKTMLLMQTLSEGNNGLDLDVIMPFILMENDSDLDNLLLMVMMNSITGGMNSADGFDQNFNVLLPLLFSDSSDGLDHDLLVLLLALQSMSPDTTMNTSSMLPLLLMEDKKSNTELVMFMTMLNNQKC